MLGLEMLGLKMLGLEMLGFEMLGLISMAGVGLLVFNSEALLPVELVRNYSVLKQVSQFVSHSFNHCCYVLLLSWILPAVTAKTTPKKGSFF